MEPQLVIESISYRGFHTKVQDVWCSKRLPVHGMIEVTRRCPLDCVHCYNNLPLRDEENARRELSTAEHIRIIDEIVEAGCLWLTYTGGEIFARGDFLDIFTHAKKKGLLVTLFTGGSLITPRIADHLAAWRPYAVEITIYGSTRETHESVTRVPGSHDKCMRAIRLLCDRKIPLSLKTIVLTVNQHEVERMRDLVEKELGLVFRLDPMVNPRLDLSQRPLLFRVSANTVVDLEMRNPKQAAEWKDLDREFGGCFPALHPKREIYFCKAGINAFAIDAYGGMNLCLFSPGAKYDLRSGRFLTGWEGAVLAERRRKVSRVTKCLDCSIRHLCGVCPPNGELEHGDPEASPAFYCEVAHLRARALDVSVQPHGECQYCQQIGGGDLSAKQ
jgi:radical SAM protein with 4Fe4S-binding SPASM domain